MSLNSFATSLTGLALILTVVAIPILGERYGFLIYIVDPPKPCIVRGLIGETNNIVVTLHEHQTATIRGDELIKLSVLGTRLREIFATRAEPLMFVRADPGSPTQISCV